MNNKQFELLIALYDKKKIENSIGHPYDILIHSILNTIDLNILIKKFVSNSIPELKKSILSNISKRLRFYKYSEKLYEDLKIMMLDGASYLESQRIRNILELVLVNIDESYKLDFFNTYFFSKYSNDKKASIKYIQYVDKHIGMELLNELFDSENFVYLDHLIRNEKYKCLIEKYLIYIWDLDPPFYFKKSMIELIAPDNILDFEFLKEKEVDLYILARILNNSLQRSDALILLEKISPKNRHFAIFNLSKVLTFDELEHSILKIISN